MIRLSYLVLADAPGLVAELSSALARQTAASEIELVVASPHPLALAEQEPLSVRCVVASADEPDGARETAIRAARGEIVALGETHVVPAPGWARSVLDAHDRGVTAVLPRMVNANPASVLSQAAFLLDYGRYAGRARARTRVPTYNATVRRSALLDLPDLTGALAPGDGLDDALRARGVTIEQELGAIVAHVNVDRPVHWAFERLLGGVLLGRSRSASFGALRRAAYALAAPLIAGVVFARALRNGRGETSRGVVPTLALGSSLWALGEAIGYLAPVERQARRRMGAYERYKRAYARRTE